MLVLYAVVLVSVSTIDSYERIALHCGFFFIIVHTKTVVHKRNDTKTKQYGITHGEKRIEDIV